MRAVKAQGRMWLPLFFPAALALDYKFQKTKINHEFRIIAVVFAIFLETAANLATGMIKPVATYLWASLRSDQCKILLTKGQLFYRKKQYDKALECMIKAREINKNNPYPFSDYQGKRMKQRGKIYYWLGKCYRRQGSFEITRLCWELVRDFGLADTALNKNIEHKLVKIELTSEEPLFKASPEDFHRLSSWEVIASRTYCEKVFTAAARNAILKELEKTYSKPEIRMIFDVVAKLVRKHPDKFNCLILSPQTMEKYYGGKGSVRGFYNMKYSICASMDPKVGFTYKNLGTIVHECTHLAMKTGYHEQCKPSCSPFKCHDQREKEEFEQVELDTLTIILNILQSLYAGETLDFNTLASCRAKPDTNKDKLIASIADFSRKMSKDMISGYQNECHIIEHMLEAYNLFLDPDSSGYDVSEIPSELIARIPQLSAEIQSDSAFDAIAPLKSYYDHKVCPYLTAHSAS